MEGRTLGALVIEGPDSTALESLTPALRSHFSEIYVVGPNGAPIGGKADDTVQYVAHFDDINLNTVSGQALVRVPSNLRIEGIKELRQLHHDMKHKSRSRTYFGVSSRLDAQKCNKPWLGFYLVLAVVDWWRALASLWGYQRPGDLRAIALTTVYPQRKHIEAEPWWIFLPGWSLTSWCCCSRYAMTRRAKHAAHLVQHVKAGDEGAQFVREFRAHPHYSWFLTLWPIPMPNCLWLFPFALYYYLFALPWWNWLATALVSGYVPGLVANREVYRVLAAIAYEYPMSWVWWIAAALHLLLMVVPIVYVRMRLGPLPQLLFILLYPLYLTLSPLVWFVIKITA